MAKGNSSTEFQIKSTKKKLKKWDVPTTSMSPKFKICSKGHLTILWCWWPVTICRWLFRYVGGLFNVITRLPTSQSGHRHILSPTSVINIGLAVLALLPKKTSSWLDRYKYFMRTNLEWLTEVVVRNVKWVL